ncbi:MAG: hypothetical protein J1E37_06705 [Prevotella sp.]|nr:hypothetical protein [Prevotella sp.]
MKEMTDEELDLLIGTAFERQQVLEEIHASVMADVRRSALRSALHCWLRLVAFAVGLPMVLLGFAYGMYYVYTSVPLQAPVVAAMLLSSVSMLYYGAKAVQHFSIDEIN